MPKIKAIKDNHFLVVDDHPANIFIITLILDDLGYSYDTAENGLVAVGKFKPDRYRAIFMDIDMPIMDGYEACKQIRGIEGVRTLKLTPIIIVTATSINDVKRNAADFSIHHIFSKPFAYEDVVEKIQNIAA